MRFVKSYPGSFSIDRCIDGDTVLEFLFHEEDYADPEMAPP